MRKSDPEITVKMTVAELDALLSDCRQDEIEVVWDDLDSEMES